MGTRGRVEDFAAFTDTDWNAFPTSAELTITNLDPGATYEIRISAWFTGQQHSDWSPNVTGQAAGNQSATTTTPGPPSPSRESASDDTIATALNLGDLATNNY